MPNSPTTATPKLPIPEPVRSREPLVPPHKIPRLERNLLAKQFSNALAVILFTRGDQNLLPPTPTELALYTSLRQWPSSGGPAATYTQDAYEKQFDYQFWDDAGSRLVIVDGEVGSGKS